MPSPTFSAYADAMRSTLIAFGDTPDLQAVFKAGVELGARMGKAQLLDEQAEAKNLLTAADSRPAQQEPNIGVA